MFRASLRRITRCRPSLPIVMASRRFKTDGSIVEGSLDTVESTMSAQQSSSEWAQMIAHEVQKLSLPKKAYETDLMTLKLQSNKDTWIASFQSAKLAREANPPNDAYTGRTVSVGKSGLSRAFQTLENISKANRVKIELKEARRHERRGDKRRRLASQRWRRLFSHEVRKNIVLVNKIRKRGA